MTGAWSVAFAVAMRKSDGERGAYTWSLFYWCASLCSLEPYHEEMEPYHDASHWDRCVCIWIWTGWKKFIKVVLRKEQILFKIHVQLWWKVLIHFKCWLLYIHLNESVYVRERERDGGRGRGASLLCSGIFLCFLLALTKGCTLTEPLSWWTKKRAIFATGSWLKQNLKEDKSQCETELASHPWGVSKRLLLKWDL